MNLFIIGNGFDKAHNLKTSYVDFRNYIEDQDWSYLEMLEKMYGFCINSKKEHVENLLWKEFEKNLSVISEDELIDSAVSIDMGLESGDVGIEDTLDSYFEEQYGFIKSLNEFLKNWINEIEIKVPQRTNKFDIGEESLFLNFNYTLLLENVYGIEAENILHIHGSIDENTNSPVIGHGDKLKIDELRQRANRASEGYFEKESSIYNALANYYERTLKDVNHYISINSGYFNRLKDVEQIFVIGNSFGDVDMPYFHEVKRNVKKDSIWNVYYYDDGDNLAFKEKVKSIGVDESKIKMNHSNSFFINR
ncbi:bacteriophage abortive infection AbiH family protein [Fusibacter ferrireducens]|uniref:Bacteriophage abortive infection AbiH family protein n=1 Tax=Fusibacter ferrireducens TaxID=2785058 RepID=A0ABS0A0S7_9FIRM|nr:bacteriophage abortive infection AbiH family protein [Fusibacter ferrireducens]MBF4696048.1 bacteriophage abortive infection AbiH family protein [Fusibacter ferrireducens]